MLANNAGVIFSDQRRTTTDRHELTFQVNDLAPFLLTALVTNRLIESGGASSTPPAWPTPATATST